MDYNKKLIFLTGIPRSGTTWAAKAIAAATSSRLVYEPFNWKVHPQRINYHMKYLPAGSNDEEFLRILNASIKPLLPFWDFFAGTKNILIKDVHTCMALEYIWQQLQPRIIILMRHPCAVAGSWSSLGLEARSRLDILLNQKDLYKKYLKPFERHINSSNDYFFEVGAYWGASYFIMDQFARKHPEWQWITHEWLCDDPVAHYYKLLNNLDLEMNEKGIQFLEENNRARKKGEGPHSTARVSRSEPDKWKAFLTEENIQKVLSGAAPFELLIKYNT